MASMNGLYELERVVGNDELQITSKFEIFEFKFL